jgi:hypothetical protein
MVKSPEKKPKGSESTYMVLAEMARVEQQDCLRPLITLTGNESRQEYLDCYLTPLIELIRDRDGNVAQKILAQAQLQKAGLGDPDTWVILPEDRNSLINIVTKYTSTGRLPWIGVAINPDGSDPTAVELSFLAGGVRPSKPPLYRGPKGEGEKGLTHHSQLADFYRTMRKFSHEHPATSIQCYKVFPQDLGIDTQIGRSSFDTNRISFRQYLSTLNAREDERETDSDDQYVVEIDIAWPFADLQPVIMVDKLDDARYLLPHLNSLSMWEKFGMLSRQYYYGTIPVATEFMVKNPGKTNGSIKFFNDINASSGPPKSDHRHTISDSIIKRLGSAPIITSKQRDLLKAIKTISQQLPESSDRLGIHENDVPSIQFAIEQLSKHIPAWEIITTDSIMELIRNPSKRGSHAQLISMLKSSLSKQPTLSQFQQLTI